MFLQSPQYLDIKSNNLYAVDCNKLNLAWNLRRLTYYYIIQTVSRPEYTTDLDMAVSTSNSTTIQLAAVAQ